jgi:hypothetical protein
MLHVTFEPHEMLSSTVSPSRSVFAATEQTGVARPPYTRCWMKTSVVGSIAKTVEV